MDRKDETKPSVKVVLLGNSGAGKTSLSQRFVFNTFNHYSESTIGACFFAKHMLIKDKDKVPVSSDEESRDEDKSQRSIKFHGELSSYLSRVYLDLPFPVCIYDSHIHGYAYVSSMGHRWTRKIFFTCSNVLQGSSCCCSCV